MFDREEEIKTKALVFLDANYGGNMSVDLQDLFLTLLEPYPAQVVQRAIMQVIETYEFKTVPPFAVIKKAIDKITGLDAESIALQAKAEWDQLQKKIEKHGYYAQPPLHETTEYVLGLMGGWGQACQWDLFNLHFKEKAFVSHWIASHGRIDFLSLGADGVLKALATGRDRNFSTGPKAIGASMTKVLGGPS